jgi:O-antigen/teichoic acid export membrane protein
MTTDVAMTEQPGLFRRREAVSQAIFVIGERVIQLIPQLATIVLISRLSGRSFFGEYALVLTWSATFQLLAHFAITECLSREMAHDPSESQRQFLHGLVLAALMSVAVLPVMVGVAWAFHYPPGVTHAIWMAAGLLPAAGVLAACRAALLVRQRIEYMLAVALLEALVVLPANIHWVLTGSGLLPIVGTIVAGRWIAAGGCLVAVDRFAVPLRGPVRRATLKALWHKLLPYGIGSLLIFPNVRFDVLILSKLAVAAQIGLYLAAVKFMDVLFIVPLSFFMVMLPRTASVFASPRPDLEWLERSLAWYFGLAMPAGVGILVFARGLVLTVYGRQFDGTTVLLQLQMITFMLLAVDVALAMIIKAAGYQRVDVRFVGVSTSLNVALCFLLIPLAGGTGAALALIVSVLAGVVLRWLFVHRTVARLRWRTIAARPLALSGFLAVVFGLAGDSAAWPVLALAYGAGYVTLAVWYLPTIGVGVRNLLKGLPRPA